MEVESMLTMPLIHNKDLQNPIGFEDSQPLFLQYASEDFSIIDIVSCSCLGFRDKLSCKEIHAYNKLLAFTKESYSIENNEHRRILLGMWHMLFEEEPPINSKLSSERWKDIGFQNIDPGTDFRSGGFLALSQMIEFIEDNRDLVKGINEKDDFLFAISSINVSFFLKRYFLMAGPADYLGKTKEVCSKSIFKAFCAMAAKDERVLNRMHQIILKDVYYYWLEKKMEDKSLNIMGFNKVFSDVKLTFHRRIKKSIQKDISFLENIYERKLEKRKEKLKK